MAKMHNGKTVKEGDHVFYINSDGRRCEGYVQRRESSITHPKTGKRLMKGTLFFWNICFNISDYHTLDFVNQ